MSVCAFGNGVLCVDTEAGDGQQDGEGGGDAMACSCDDAMIPHTEAAAAGKLHDAIEEVRLQRASAQLLVLHQQSCSCLPAHAECNACRRAAIAHPFFSSMGSAGRTFVTPLAFSQLHSTSLLSFLLLYLLPPFLCEGGTGL